MTQPDDSPIDEQHTVPSPATVDADRVDAGNPHMPDRLPTEEEEEAAERGAALSPDVSKPYKEAIHRGAEIKGEGQIEPD